MSLFKEEESFEMERMNAISSESRALGVFNAYKIAVLSMLFFAAEYDEDGSVGIRYGFRQ
jgi:hypothetical protein